MRKVFDYSEDIIVVLDGGIELEFESIEEIWEDDSGKFLHFKDYFNNEVAIINCDKILYLQIKSVSKW